MTIATCVYQDDTHLECHSLDQAMDILLARGFDLYEYGLAYVPEHRWPDTFSAPMSYHIFDSMTGKEVANFCACLHDVVPALIIFDRPRTWGASVIAAHRQIELGGYIERHKRRQEQAT